jgi:hypothetical protein
MNFEEDDIAVVEIFLANGEKCDRCWTILPEVEVIQITYVRDVMMFGKHFNKSITYLFFFFNFSFFRSTNKGFSNK